MKKEMKDFKKDNAGRSMTEMLGVLAIIGVLSLGGIIGYKLAMNRYAANQIAYEINMMKTDAKVKIMQGNDRLTLGQPYDGGTIRFGDYATTFGCSFVQDEDAENIVVEEAATCQVANAYYIELQNIPEGICKPLANLIENMNDLIAFDINPKENGEGGNCEEGDNILNAVFSAEPGDLEVLKCDPGECPDGLHCLNHLCVECTKPEDCTEGNAGICTENNTCDYCDEGEVRDENNNCVKCMKDTDCRDKENAPHCDSETHTCGNCPIGTPYWSDTLSKCVECTADVHCTDKETNPVCKNTGECGPCPHNSFWDGSKCQEGCQNNSQCTPGEYCYKISGAACDHEWVDENDFSGSCRKVTDDLISGKVDGAIYYGSKKTMNWWSVQRFCKAAGQLGYGNGQMAVWGTPDFKCNPSITLKPKQYCHKNSSGDIHVGDFDDLSITIEELRAMFKVTKAGEWDTEAMDIWLNNESTDSCSLFEIQFSTPSNNNKQKPGYVMYSGTISHLQGANHALCQPNP